MSRTDDVDPVIEHKESNRGTDQVIPMYQRVDQQFLEDQLWNLGHTGSVHPSPGLYFVKIAKDKGHGIVEDLPHRAGIIFGVNIICDMNLIAGIADRLDDELRSNPFRSFCEQQYTGKVQSGFVDPLRDRK